MTTEELMLDYEEWIEYYVRKKTGSEEFFTPLSINNMGIHNIDKLHLIEDPVLVFADYRDKEGKALIIKRATVKKCPEKETHFS